VIASFQPRPQQHRSQGRRHPPELAQHLTRRRSFTELACTRCLGGGQGRATANRRHGLSTPSRGWAPRSSSTTSEPGSRPG
jgi:hypothetical protein